MYVKGFIEDLKNMYGDDEFMDEEILEILHENSFQKKGIQTSFHDIQENSQQLIMSSFPEMDISLNSDSTSNFSTCSFSEISSKEESGLELELEERHEPKYFVLHCNPSIYE